MSDNYLKKMSEARSKLAVALYECHKGHYKCYRGHPDDAPKIDKCECVVCKIRLSIELALDELEV